MSKMGHGSKLQAQRTKRKNRSLVLPPKLRNGPTFYRATGVRLDSAIKSGGKDTVSPDRCGGREIATKFHQSLILPLSRSRSQLSCAGKGNGSFLQASCKSKAAC